jgi:hypothetical protein
MLAVVVLVCSLFALLLGAILVSNRLQSWLKVSNWGSVYFGLWSVVVVSQ